jgi:hypothetical protein
MSKRFRRLFFLLLSFGLAGFTASLQGKDASTDLLFQSTSDVYGELAPCG